jgi:hypothetical protein
MALSAGDALTIAGYLTSHAGTTSGGTDTSKVAGWIRSRWGGSGNDAAVIAAYAESRADTDLVNWAIRIRKSGDGSRLGMPLVRFPD